MSHELRTPLNGILGFADLLKEDLAGTPQAEFAEAIHDSGTHLLALVNDILDIGKLEAGKAELELEQVPLAELLGQVVGLHTAPAQKKGLRVALDISSGVPPVVELDRTKVTRVLNNLLHNAVKFTQRGKVDVLVGRSGDEVIFAVRDTGPGIPGGKQATLFERFSQGDSSETRAHEGTGLGLALSRDLVTLMGGRIWFKSQFGHGSTFWFSLPIRAPKSAGAAAAAAAPAAVDA
jgi:signal transduction histidine kinase